MLSNRGSVCDSHETRASSDGGAKATMVRPADYIRYPLGASAAVCKPCFLLAARQLWSDHDDSMVIALPMDANRRFQ